MRSRGLYEENHNGNLHHLTRRDPAEAVGIAPGPGIDPPVGPGIDPGIDPGDRSRGVLSDGEMTAVAQRYTPGGIRLEIPSSLDISCGEKRRF